MYRIGNDKRKTQSARLVCRGLEELMRKHDYNDITVTSLINTSGVGRATFYRLFDDKSDVVLYQMESVFTELLRSTGPYSDPNAMVMDLFELCFGRKEFFLSIIEANLYGEFQTRLASILSQKLSFVQERTGLDYRNWQYFIQVRTAMLLSALRVAITQFNEDNPVEVLETLNKLFGKQPALFHEAGTAAGAQE
ncbi:putative TetR family transcriptional regulator [Paenibacillus sp. FSL R7-269]|uniref:TetR/AcrR family transcriptional regulator n=1 Tax=Paenibacillus sp. FSL R7-269 TaxID=1226755 RepID=UPI0003E1E520|nr:TetR/AcrR family transcriptional regulator [Paenibacillus sp. FSL R7-269]ETT53107.1 putative TetR family transcriptional regulator [Paenibacillus sp. FSL R7-269]